MTKRRLVFLDTETTSLDPVHRQAWEVGLIVREFYRLEDEIPDAAGSDVIGHRADRERHWFIDVRELDMDKAHNESLTIGRFDERYDLSWAHDPAVVIDEVYEELHDATVVGSNPWFDLHTLRLMSMRWFAAETENDAHEPWHYRAVDVTSMAMPVLNLTHPLGVADTAKALGLDVAVYKAHTAIGDARLVRDVYDAILTGGAVA